MLQHHDFLKSLHAYPLPSFPGHEKEGVLQMLLRKKLEPQAEKWVAQYSSPKDGESTNGVENGAPEGGMKSQDYAKLWDWAGETVSHLHMEFMDDMESDYTMAEKEQGIENVVTGLKRKLNVGLGDDDSDEEDEDEDEDVEKEEKEKEEAKMETVASEPPSVAEPGVDPSLPPMKLEMVLKFMTTGQLPPS
jgi:mediator of RNA polymerase II transcription subunit 8, fungi type